MATLRFLTGPRAGTEHELDGELRLGRKGSDLDIDDQEISRSHLRVSVVDDGVEVEDLGSSNGTWVGGRRVAGTTLLTETTEVRIGETTLEVVVPPPPPPPDATRLAPIPDDATRIGAVPPPPPPSDATIVGPAPSDPWAKPPAREERPAAAAPPPPPAAAPPRPPAAAPPPPPAAVPPRPPAAAPPPTRREERPAAAAPPAFAAPARTPTYTSGGLPNEPFGAFAASGAVSARPRRGPATRQLAPATITTAVIIATAIALIVYFAAR